MKNPQTAAPHALPSAKRRRPATPVSFFRRLGTRLLPVLALLWTCVPCAASESDWPQWRGPFFNGSSNETGMPASWSAERNTLWVAPLPGESGATPAITQGRVFITSTDRRNQNLYAICLDLYTGEILWSKTCGDAGRKAPYNKDASPSPIAARNRVWFLFGSGALLACDHDGNLIWEKNLERDFGPLTQVFLYGASPLLYRERLYLAVLRGDPDERPPALREESKPEDIPDSFLLCLDAETGAVIWKQDRPSEARGIESRDSYATPVPLELPDGRAEILVIGADYLTGHDWDTGQENWRFPYNISQTYRQRVCPTPVVAGDLIVAVKPRYGAVFALPAGLRGKLAPDAAVWEYAANTPDVPSPLYYKERLYLLHDKQGVLSCLDPRTGRLIWEGKIGGSALYHASPVAVDGKIYCINLKGEVAVVRASDAGFRVLSRSTLGGHPAPSSVAIAERRLLIRTEANLYCIGAPNLPTGRQP